MVDLHRHSEFSQFDGFGNAKEIARYAKELNYTSCSVSDHGVVNGWMKHYKACEENELKPILGVECYYQPFFNQNEQSYHLCLFAKNVTGYKNINKLLFLANKKYFYFRPRVTFELLKKYSEGVICTTACIASIFSSEIKGGNIRNAFVELKKFKDIFNDDFYIEIQPYKIDNDKTQEKVNVELIKLSKKLEIKCILTTDSHYVKKEDFDTYKKMHEIAKHNIDIEQTYSERYMESEEGLKNRFIKMHKEDFKNIKTLAKEFIQNLEEIEYKVDGEIIKKLKVQKSLNFGVNDSNKYLYNLLLNNLNSKIKNREKYNIYLKRMKEEFNVIESNGFSDYFLIVSDYVNWAKDNDIKVGPGRGSVCNSLCAYLLGITDVDSVMFGLDFTRFLRIDKKKMPDIDVDFEQTKRDEVVSYITKKYKGSSCQICSYGLYKSDNALNDLFKVCGVFEKNEQKDIKTYVKRNINEANEFVYDEIKNDVKCKNYNEQYDDIIKHFSKLYKKVRFIGTHAAGVAIVNGNLLNYASVEKRSGIFSCVYDLEDLEELGILKFDILGLKTLNEIKELEEITKKKYKQRWLLDENIYLSFKNGNTDGIFQFESDTVKRMLNDIDCSSFSDVRAANSMNRPGPLQLQMPEQYAKNKFDLQSAKKFPFYEQTKDTYGTIIYQEQIMRICKDVAGMSDEFSDKMMKIVKDQDSRDRLLLAKDGIEREIKKAFIRGMIKKGMKKEQANEMFEKISVYSFNKGHATGYSIIGIILMYYKVYYPEVFWFVKMKYANKENLPKYKKLAIQNGNIILLPHVNASSVYSVSDRFGDMCIQEGLSNIDGVGLKVAQAIEEERKKNGDYTSYFDFKSRLPRRIANTRVLNALESKGALEFNDKKYLARVEKYNIGLRGR